jgi:uncharacterized alpha-E superfamily protein
MMLARVADSLYWIGRYVERAEHISRLCDIMLTATLDQSEGAIEVARVALAAMGDRASGELTALDAVDRLVFDREDPGSVVTSLARGRENARQVRDQITTEMWERLNLLYLRVTGAEAARGFSQRSSAFLHEVIADLHLFKGATDATMNHGEGWRFLLLGVYLERAQLIARLLEVCLADAEEDAPMSDHLTQMAVLRMACALEPYLRTYTAELEPRRLLEFLMFDQEFPRSVRFAILQMEEHLTNLARLTQSSGPSGPERLAGRLRARLQFADLDESEGSGRLLGAVTLECSRIHHAIYETFVAYPLELRLPA